MCTLVVHWDGGGARAGRDDASWTEYSDQLKMGLLHEILSEVMQPLLNIGARVLMQMRAVQEHGAAFQ